VFGFKASGDALWEGDGEGFGDASGVGLVEVVDSLGCSDDAGADVDCLVSGEDPQAPRPTATAATVPVNRLRRLNSVIMYPLVKTETATAAV